MGKATHSFTAFNAGEFSPLMYARTDFDKRAKGCKTLKNFLPTRQGPMTSRSGSRFVAEVLDSDNRTGLLEFEFSATQAYMIECGEYYFRFYKDQSLITGTGTQAPTGVTCTSASPSVFTATGHALVKNDIVLASGFTENAAINGNYYVVKNVSGNNLELRSLDGDLDNNAGDVGGTAETTGGTLTWHGIQHVYPQADLFEDSLFDLKTAQSADVLYITHRDYPVRKLSRTSDTNWTFTLFGNSDATTVTNTVPEDGPYLSLNTDTSKTLQPGAATGNNIALTAVGHSPFASTDVGRVVRLGNDSGTSFGWGVIVSYTSPTVVNIDIFDDFASGVAVWEWQLGAWSETTGYPATVAFFQNRLCFSGVPSTPQRIDFSVTGEYERFAPTVLNSGDVTDELALAVTVSSNQVNYIRWIADDEKGLLAGSIGGEWLIRANTLGAAITPTNVQATQSTTFGSANLPGLRAGNATLFVQRSQRKVRELTYSFDKPYKQYHLLLNAQQAMSYQ